MENLYNYLLWYNPYESVWYAIERNHTNEFFAGKRDEKKYYKSSRVETLIEIVSNPAVLNQKS